MPHLSRLHHHRPRRTQVRVCEQVCSREQADAARVPGSTAEGAGRLGRGREEAGLKVGRQEEEVCRSIQRSFEQLKAVLERREAELVGKVGWLAQEKKNALAAQKTVLHVALKEIKLLAEFVESNVESTSDQDLMSIRTQLQSKVEEEEKCHRQLSLEPTATANIACCLPSPDVIPSDLGSVFVQPTPVLIEKVESTELGSPVQVTLSAPTASLGDISTGLKCVADPSPSLEGEVVENGVGTFSISVTPQVRDQTRRFVGFRLPWEIAINNKKQLIVAETGCSCGSGRKIIVMDRDGKKVQNILCGQFKDPRGVAVASDGVVYVTDIDAKCLFKFNSKGKHLKTVHNELQKPYAVKIMDNQVYVVDLASQQIKIFDMAWNVVGTIYSNKGVSTA